MINNLKKIYITGVSGFIGSRVAKLFVENNYQVVGITRRFGSVVSRELGIDVIEVDLNNANNINLEAADAIIHCATPNEILSKNICEGLSLSIVGTAKLLEACRKAKIFDIIFFSTAQVYGTELNGYLDETTPVNCQTPYAINHFLGEELCKFYCEAYGFNIIALRPSNIYGMPEISTVNRKTLVPMCFVEEAINLGSITLRSSGKQTRNFVPIEDVAKVSFKLIEDFPKGFSLRNCGSNFCSSMLDIVSIVAKQYQKNYKNKLTINIENNQPETSNIFEYRSKYDECLEVEEYCRNRMRLTIEKLFKFHKNI